MRPTAINWTSFLRPYWFIEYNVLPSGSEYNSDREWCEVLPGFILLGLFIHMTRQERRNITPMLGWYDMVKQLNSNFLQVIIWRFQLVVPKPKEVSTSVTCHGGSGTSGRLEEDEGHAHI